MEALQYDVFNLTETLQLFALILMNMSYSGINAVLLSNRYKTLLHGRKTHVKAIITLH